MRAAVQVRSSIRRGPGALGPSCLDHYCVRQPFDGPPIPDKSRSHSAGILPLSALCIHPERAAWVLYVDATCINYDGNVFDAALIAMVAALKNSANL